MRAPLAFLLLLLLALPLQARDPVAEREIHDLLSFVAKSDARFIRNGKEYPPDKAAEHLRGKVEYAGERVKSAEDFIQGIATKSSVSGKLYQVKLSDGTMKPAGEWLSEELARERRQKH